MLASGRGADARPSVGLASLPSAGRTSLPSAWLTSLASALLGAVLAALVPSAAGAQSLFRDPEPRIEATLPDPWPSVPPAEKTVGFYVSPTTTNRFAVDPKSIAIDGGKVVRFTLLITSASGVRNVSYEALACDRAEQRLLAIARADGSWSVLRNSSWRPLNLDDTVNRHMPELYRRLCEGGGAAGASPQALVARLLADPSFSNN
jgi:hypothetical protein